MSSFKQCMRPQKCLYRKFYPETLILPHFALNETTFCLSNELHPNEINEFQVLRSLGVVAALDVLMVTCNKLNYNYKELIVP